jgi:hypothetical protein
VTVTKEGYDGNPRTYRVQAICLDATVDMFHEPLPVVHAVDRWGQGRQFFETTDSLKALIDDALGND